MREKCLALGCKWYQVYSVKYLAPDPQAWWVPTLMKLCFSLSWFRGDLELALLSTRMNPENFFCPNTITSVVLRLIGVPGNYKGGTSSDVNLASLLFDDYQKSFRYRQSTVLGNYLHKGQLTQTLEQRECSMQWRLRCPGCWLSSHVPSGCSNKSPTNNTLLKKSMFLSDSSLTFLSLPPHLFHPLPFCFIWGDFV